MPPSSSSSPPAAKTPKRSASGGSSHKHSSSHNKRSKNKNDDTPPKPAVGRRRRASVPTLSPPAPRASPAATGSDTEVSARRSKPSRTSPARTPAAASTAYAGAMFENSPAPDALPAPDFTSDFERLSLASSPSRGSSPASAAAALPTPAHSGDENDLDAEALRARSRQLMQLLTAAAQQPPKTVPSSVDAATLHIKQALFGHAAASPAMSAPAARPAPSPATPAGTLGLMQHQPQQHPPFLLPHHPMMMPPPPSSASHPFGMPMMPSPPMLMANAASPQFPLHHYPNWPQHMCSPRHLFHS